MNQKDKLVLNEFAQKIAELNLTVNCEFSTSSYDYEVITYVDEVQILDIDENIVARASRVLGKHE